MLPIGDDAITWSTMDTRRAVLVVAHTVTATTRLLDVLPAISDDPRIQVLFTTPETSAFTAGVLEFLTDIGARIISWQDAVEAQFDLAVAAGHGDLRQLSAPILVMPHGAGYNKHRKPETGNRKPETGNRKPETGNRKPETGNRKPETGNRKPETGNRKPVYGLPREQLVHGGQVVPTAIVLSHAEQRERLRRSCPEAVPRTVVADDPCYDRLLASLRHRDEYRAALHTCNDQTLVVLTSTWGRWSLLGQDPDLPIRLLGQLPMDEYRLAAIVHPNVWHWHGAWQTRAWLERAARAGLQLVPAREGWRGALVAADLLIGDHGSVATYAAAIGIPVLLGAGTEEELDPDGSTSALIRTAPRFDRTATPREQIDEAIRTHTPDRYTRLTRRTFDIPGQSLRTLQKIMYQLMDLDAPGRAPSTRRVPAPQTARHVVTAAAVLAAMDPHTDTVDIQRFPADTDPPAGVDHTDRHLCVDLAETDLGLLQNADILVRRSDSRARATPGWAQAILDAYPGCRIVASIMSTGSCMAFPRPYLSA
jgi:hypothetical protein